MTRFLVSAVVFACSCFSPTFTEGLPCSETRQCPGTQVCTADDLCYEPGNDPISDGGVPLDAEGVDGGSIVCSGRILFRSRRDDVPQIYINDLEVGDTLLSGSGVNEGGAKWSPNGERVAFGRQDAPTDFEIVVVRPGSDNGVNITNSTSNDGFVDWSPAGDLILFSTNRDGNNEVYTSSPDGTQLQNLTNSPADDRPIGFSPDGSKILFESDLDEPNELWLMNTDGSGKQQLNINSNDPAFSPDGTKLVYSDPGVDQDIFVMDLTTLVSTPLLVTTEEETNPDWSPDGTLIAFEGGNFVQRNVFVAAPDGSNPINLTPASASPDRTPRWSPDGEFIAFASQRTGLLEIFTMRKDGSDAVRRTLVDTGNDDDPRWQPCQAR